LPPQAATSVVVYTKPVRAIAAVLVAISRASLPFLLYRVWRATDPPITPPMLFELLLVLSITPAVAAWIVARIGRATVEVTAAGLTLKRARVEFEFPASAIERVEPWRIPLPGPGFALRMRSGRLATYGIQALDPAALISALTQRAGVARDADGNEHPVVAWAHARAAGRPVPWTTLLGKFGIFALPVATILFNAHQHISYGGFWGQYYLEGALPYLRTAVIYLATVVAYLILYASALRAVAEIITFTTSHLAPTSVPGTRRIAERFCALAYYLGVPILLALRFRP
jgi:hypothetical protein